MTDEQRNHVMKLAEYDVKGCLESIREWHYLPWLAKAYLNLYRGINDSDKEKIRESMDYVENIIEFVSDSKYYDAHAFASYLNCRGHYYNALDEPEEAFQDFYEATAVEPDYARWQLDLATFIENQDWQSIARKHKELAEKSRKSKHLLNELK